MVLIDSPEYSRMPITYLCVIRTTVHLDFVTPFLPWSLIGQAALQTPGVPFVQSYTHSASTTERQPAHGPADRKGIPGAVFSYLGR